MAGRAQLSQLWGFGIPGNSIQNPGKQQVFDGEEGSDTNPKKSPQNQLLQGDTDLLEPDFGMGKLWDWIPREYLGSFPGEQARNGLNPLTSQPQILAWGSFSNPKFPRNWEKIGK